MTADAVTVAVDSDLVRLVSELVSIPSVSGEEQAVQDHIEGWLLRAGMSPRREHAADGLVNVVAEIEGRPGGPTLWIGGHCDTVGVGPGWRSDPHHPEIRDGNLYGRGTMDMKGGLAVALIVARALHQTRETWSGRVILAALADEEARSRGAEAHAAGLGPVDGAIMLEPHFDDVVIGAMGKVNLDVEVTGRAAHASRPWEGVNAVTEAGRLLAELGQLERPARPGFVRPSHCVLGVESGDGTYAISVPDSCRFRINWHYGPGETVEDGVALVQRLADGLTSPASFRVMARAPAYDGYLLAADDPFVSAFAQSYTQVLGRSPNLEVGKGVSDANILSGRLGIPTLLFGPRGGNMHGADEYVELSTLQKSQDVLMVFAQAFLAPTLEKAVK